MKQLSKKDLDIAKRDYSEDKLSDKIVKFAASAGKQVIYYVLILYNVLKSSKLDYKGKATIIGALGYFICPVDLIPDLVPVAGYSDDLSALLLALVQVYSCIDEEILEKSALDLRKVFDISEGEIKEFNQKFQLIKISPLVYLGVDKIVKILPLIKGKRTIKN